MGLIPYGYIGGRTSEAIDALAPEVWLRMSLPGSPVNQGTHAGWPAGTASWYGGTPIFGLGLPPSEIGVDNCAILGADQGALWEMLGNVVYNFGAGTIGVWVSSEASGEIARLTWDRIYPTHRPGAFIREMRIWQEVNASTVRYRAQVVGNNASTLGWEPSFRLVGDLEHSMRIGGPRFLVLSVGDRNTDNDVALYVDGVQVAYQVADFSLTGGGTGSQHAARFEVGLTAQGAGAPGAYDEAFVMLGRQSPAQVAAMWAAAQGDS